MANKKQSTQKDRQVVSGLFWIFSPFFVLTGIALLQIVIRFIDATPSGVVLAVNLVSAIGGIIGVTLVIAGPVIGILKLIDRKR